MPAMPNFDPNAHPGQSGSNSPYGSSNAAPGTPGGKPLYLCHPFVKSALIKGSFKTIVVLPKYVDQKEWIAVNCEYCHVEVWGILANASWALPE